MAPQASSPPQLGGNIGAADVYWRPVSVLLAGPDADLAAAGGLLGGASVGLGGPSAIHEDGRCSYSISGLFLFTNGRWADMPYASGQEHVAAATCNASSSDTCLHGIVLTCAASLAPFLSKRPTRGGAQRSMRPCVDVALVPTVELHVLFPIESGSDTIGQGTAVAEPATLVACFPLPASEEAFVRLQRGIARNSPVTRSTSGQPTWPSPGNVEWMPPALGSLGLAVLHIEVDKAMLAGLSCDRLDPAALAAVGDLATLAPGQPIALCSSPFGMIKPSLFMNMEVRGAIAGTTVGGELLLVDASCLPGSEGGVVSLRMACDRIASKTPAGTPCETAAPVALLVPSFSCSQGASLKLGAAVPLRAAAASMLRCGLPADLLRAVFGPALGALEALAAAHGGSIPAAVAGRRLDTAKSGPLVPARPSATTSTSAEQVEPSSLMSVPPSLCASVCIVSTRDFQTSACAVMLSRDGLLVTTAAFVATANIVDDVIDCAIDLGSGAAPIAAEATLIHTLMCIPGATLLQLRCFQGSPSSVGITPLPWCFPTGMATELGRTVFAGVVRAGDDDSAFQDGAEVWALRLFPLGGCSLARGFVSRVVVGPRVWRPALVQAGFRSNCWSNGFDGTARACADPFAVASNEVVLLLRPGPHASLLGLRLATPAALPGGMLLPSHLLFLATPPLLALLVPGGRSRDVHRAELARCDGEWQRHGGEGYAQLCWSLEAGSEGRWHVKDSAWDPVLKARL